MPALPLPVFRVAVGKGENRSVLMPPAGNIEPVVAIGGIKKMAVVNGLVILINESECAGRSLDLAHLLQRLDAIFSVRQGSG